MDGDPMYPEESDTGLDFRSNVGEFEALEDPGNDLESPTESMSGISILTLSAKSGSTLATSSRVLLIT